MSTVHILQGDHGSGQSHPWRSYRTSAGLDPRPAIRPRGCDIRLRSTDQSELSLQAAKHYHHENTSEFALQTSEEWTEIMFLPWIPSSCSTCHFKILVVLWNGLTSIKIDLDLLSRTNWLRRWMRRDVSMQIDVRQVSRSRKYSPNGDLSKIQSTYSGWTFLIRISPLNILPIGCVSLTPALNVSFFYTGRMMENLSSYELSVFWLDPIFLQHNSKQIPPPPRHPRKHQEIGWNTFLPPIR